MLQAEIIKVGGGKIFKLEKTPKTIVTRFISNVQWITINEAIARGIYFIVNIYLARILGPSNFGLFSLAQTISFCLWITVDLGTTMYGIREVAKNKEKKEKIENLFNALFTIRIIGGILIFTLFGIVISILNISITKKFIFLWNGLYLITYSLYNEWLLKGLEKFKFLCLGQFISAISLVSVLYFVKNAEDTALASFIWSISYLPGAITLLVYYYKKLGIKFNFIFNFSICFYHISQSIYFATSAFLLLVNQYLPLIFLSIFFTSYEIGIFSAPYRIVTSITTAGFLIPMAFYPILSELFYKDRLKFKKTQNIFLKIMTSIGISIAIIGIFLADKIIKVFLGVSYTESTFTFILLMILIPLVFLRYSYGSTILSMNQQRMHSLGFLISTISASILCGILVPTFGIIGAAITLVLSESITAVTMALIYYKNLRLMRRRRI